MFPLFWTPCRGHKLRVTLLALRAHQIACHACSGAEPRETPRCGRRRFDSCRGTLCKVIETLCTCLAPESPGITELAALVQLEDHAAHRGEFLQVRRVEGGGAALGGGECGA